ncbi:MAG TPA: hypothetical protein VFL91_32490, partial [Thermomicrobiales bacterium]|nr:hypothetical protein [Thermomicrobiales bacterium]
VDRGGALGRLRRFVADLPVRAGHEPFLLALPQPDVNAARRQLARAAHAGFLDELAALDADLQRFLDAPPGTVRTGTIAQRLAAFRAFRERADAYALLLGMRQERIASALDELTAKARAVVLKGAAEPGADESSGDADQPPAPLADADAA